MLLHHTSREKSTDMHTVTGKFQKKKQETTTWINYAMIT